MLEMQVQSLGWDDPLEKKTATHSNVLAWKTPWTKKPGGLQSMWSQSRAWQQKSSSEFQYSCAYPKIESLVNKQLLALNQYFSNLKVYEKITCGLLEMQPELQQVLVVAQAFTFQIPMPKLLVFDPCVEQ